MRYILCPNCQREHFESEQFCHTCGTWLQGAETRPTTGPLNGDYVCAEFVEPDVKCGTVALVVLQTGEMLVMPSQQPILLGRLCDTCDSSLNMADFSACSGYELGISRRHAIIQRQNNDYLLVDQQSCNGTLLNGERISPYEMHRLKNGDNITLGQLHLKFYAP